MSEKTAKEFIDKHLAEVKKLDEFDRVIYTIGGFISAIIYMGDYELWDIISEYWDKKFDEKIADLSE